MSQIKIPTKIVPSLFSYITHIMICRCFFRTEPNKLTAIPACERNISGSPTVPHLSLPINKMNTRRISRPARVLEQFCPCRAAVASGVRGHGGFGGDVVFCFHPESRRSQRAEPASRRRALACVRSSRWPRGAARCLGSGGEDGAGQSGTRCAPPRVNRARPRASAEPLVCGAVAADQKHVQH